MNWEGGGSGRDRDDAATTDASSLGAESAPRGAEVAKANGSLVGRRNHRMTSCLHPSGTGEDIAGLTAAAQCTNPSGGVPVSPCSPTSRFPEDLLLRLELHTSRENLETCLASHQLLLIPGSGWPL